MTKTQEAITCLKPKPQLMRDIRRGYKQNEALISLGTDVVAPTLK